MADEVLTQSSAIPRVSWGVFLSIVAAIVGGSGIYYELKDTRERQDKWIERRNEQHQALQVEIKELNDRYHDLCHQLESVACE
jgi:hypothetical protein